MAQGSPAGLRDRLKGTGPAFGAIQTIPDAGVTAILGASGFDLVVIDCEHGPFSPGSVRSCVDALAATPAAAVIRVAANDPVLIRQALDLGAEGILVPMVGDAAAAAAAVEASRYPPAGTRGIGGGHATRYGTSLERYLSEASHSIAVLVTIETAAGVENAKDIAQVSGLDGIVIGPTDLAADLGLLGGEDVTGLKAAITRVTEAAGEGTVGIGCEPEEISDLAPSGMSLFICYADGFSIGASATAAVASAMKTWEVGSPEVKEP